MASELDVSYSFIVFFLGACYYDANQSMYVFGGCTQSSCNAAFNDLWRLDLNSKEWIRPLASGKRENADLCFLIR